MTIVSGAVAVIMSMTECSFTPSPPLLWALWLCPRSWWEHAGVTVGSEAYESDGAEMDDSAEGAGNQRNKMGMRNRGTTDGSEERKGVRKENRAWGLWYKELEESKVCDCYYKRGRAGLTIKGPVSVISHIVCCAFLNVRLIFDLKIGNFTSFKKQQWDGKETSSFPHFLILLQFLV